MGVDYDMIMPFGKFGPHKGDVRPVKDCPSDYLRYLLEEEDDTGWVSGKYGKDLLDTIEATLVARDRGYSHWNESEEEGGF